MKQELIDANKVDKIFGSPMNRNQNDTCIRIYEQILELPPVPAIPIERIKRLRRVVSLLASDYVSHGDDDIADFADNLIELIDNMIKEYKP